MCSTWGLLCPLGRLQRLRTQHLCIKLSCVSKGVLDLGPAQADEAGIRPCAPSVTALGGLHVKRHARPRGLPCRQGQPSVFQHSPQVHQAACSIEMQDRFVCCHSCYRARGEWRLPPSLSKLRTVAQGCRHYAPARLGGQPLSSCAAASDLEGRQLRGALSCS